MQKADDKKRKRLDKCPRSLRANLTAVTRKTRGEENYEYEKNIRSVKKQKGAATTRPLPRRDRKRASRTRKINSNKHHNEQNQDQQTERSTAEGSATDSSNNNNQQQQNQNQQDQRISSRRKTNNRKTNRTATKTKKNNSKKTSLRRKTNRKRNSSNSPARARLPGAKNSRTISLRLRRANDRLNNHQSGGKEKLKAVADPWRRRGGNCLPYPRGIATKEICREVKGAGGDNAQKPADKTEQVAEAEQEKEGQMSERQALALLESMKDVRSASPT